MATGCIVQTKPQSMRVDFTGTPTPDVTAKDLVLHLIGRVSADGGNGYVIEYGGPVIERLSVEQRMTLCNMSIELSARAGLVAPDDRVFEFLAGRRRASRQRMGARARPLAHAAERRGRRVRPAHHSRVLETHTPGDVGYKPRTRHRRG